MWPISVISLTYATERRKLCAREMMRAGLAFTFFDAVNGAGLTDVEIAAAYDEQLNKQEFKHPLTRSEVACYLSHRALWRQIAEGDAPGGIVLEDDFLLDGKAPALLDELTKLDLRNCVVKLHAEKPVRGELLARLPEGFRLLIPRTVPGRTLGYALGQVAARQLLARSARFTRPVDMDLKHWWEFNTLVIAVQPPVLSLRQNGEGSFLEQDRVKKRNRQEPLVFQRMFRNLIYQFRFQTAKRRASALRRALVAQLGIPIDIRSRAHDADT